MERIEDHQYSIAANERVVYPRWKEALFDLVYWPVQAFARLPWITIPAQEEARHLCITQMKIPLRDWSPALDGLRLAFLTDLHCSPQTPAEWLEGVVEETNRLHPDVILLGGDYVTRGTDYVKPVAAVLAKLKAPLGVYGVLGNHDHVSGARAVRSALKYAGVVDVNNGGHWLRVNGTRLRIAGVGDLWHDRQDLNAALAGVRADEPAILLSHNPDYAMRLTDPRVRVVLSGHTHGGQIRLPRVGALVTHSAYGNRLASGLVSFDSFQLYVSRGIGTVVVPLRYQCPPEVAVLTLSGE